MKIFITLLAFLLSSTLLSGQLNYQTQLLKPIPRAEVVDVSNLSPDFKPDMKYLEGPKQSSTRLAKIKEAMSVKYPKRYDVKPLQKNYLIHQRF